MVLSTDFIARIRQQFKSDADVFLSALDTDSPVSVRINPRKGSHLFESEKVVPWCENGRYLQQRPVFTLDALFHAGSYYPQEASSMFLWHVLNHLPNLPIDPVVLDLCAAPGGKSTLIASFLDGRGALVANELVRLRANVLMENLIKWGYSNVLVSQSDPSAFSSVESLFDVVVVDAPCSGEGMFRKDLAARAEWSLDNAAMCASRQRKIIGNIWESLKPGGYFIYSTCTFNPAENEDNIEWMINEYDAQLIDIPYSADWGIESVAIAQGKGVAFYPHEVAGEGFFMAVLQKNGNLHGAVKNKRSEKMVKAKAPAGLLKFQEQYFITSINSQLYALSQLPLMVYGQLASNLRFVYQGVGLGEMVRDELVPHQGLAMSLEAAGCYPEFELSHDDALQFLRGATSIPVDGKKGWYVATYNNQPLGFVKCLGNRINNYYPKEWRVRMNS